MPIRELTQEVSQRAMDDERGLLLCLSESRAGEGLAIRSLPQAERHPPSSAEQPASPARFSSLVVRPAGANLLLVSPELQGGGATPAT